MSKNATDYIGDELDRIIDYCRVEFDVNYAEILGMLQMKSWFLCQEANENYEDEQ